MIPVSSSHYADRRSFSASARGGSGGSSGSGGMDSGGRAHRPPLKRGDACLYCRKRRIRCSATKPSCHHCTKLKRECVYDTSKPVSRVRQLENKIAELEESLREANAIIQAQQANAGNVLPIMPDALGVPPSTSYSTGSSSLDPMGTSLHPGSHLQPPGADSSRPGTPMGPQIGQFATPQSFTSTVYEHTSPTPSVPSSMRLPGDDSFEWDNLDSSHVTLNPEGQLGTQSVAGPHGLDLSRPVSQGGFFAHPATMLQAIGDHQPAAVTVPSVLFGTEVARRVPLHTPARARSESAVPSLSGEGSTPRILPVPDHGLAATPNLAQVQVQAEPAQHQQASYIALARHDHQAPAAAVTIQQFYTYHEDPDGTASSRHSPVPHAWQSTPSSTHQFEGSRPNEQSLHGATGWYETHHQPRGTPDQLSSPSLAACALDLQAALRELDHPDFAFHEPRLDLFASTSAVMV